MLTSLLGLLYGLAQGVRHAFEPDHLAAVSTMVAEQRSARASAAYAAAWGFGHASVLIVVGGALFVMRAEMPPRVADGFELAVAGMLIVLGARALRMAARYGAHGPVHAHHHGAVLHAHAAGPGHVHLRGWTFARRPLLVGCMHGLAGSGALTALVVATLPTPWAGLLYMALYAGGAMLGMALLAGVLGVPLARVVRSARGMPILLSASGLVSVGLGVVWGVPLLTRLFP